MKGSDLTDFDATSFSESQPSTSAAANSYAKDTKNEEISALVDKYLYDFSYTEDWYNIIGCLCLISLTAPAILCNYCSRVAESTQLTLRVM